MNYNNTIHNKIIEIAEVLTKYQYEDIGLLDGKMGVCIFFFYMNKYTGEIKYYNKAIELLEEIIQSFENQNMVKSMSYCSGYSGIIRGLTHIVKNKFIEADIIELQKESETVLYEYALAALKKEEFDFLHESIGVILTFTEISQDLNKLDILADTLIQYVKTNKNFWSSKFHLHRDNCLTYIDIGISHGVSNILYSLTLIFQKTQNKNIYEFTVEGYKWLLNQQKMSSFGVNVFPIAIKDGEPVFGRNMAWCYGGISISLNLYKSALILELEELKKSALTIALNHTKIIENFEDTGICHGTGGLGYMFYLLHKKFNLEIFLDKSSFFFEETIKKSTFIDGLAGYKSKRLDFYANDISMLEGISGTALAMIAFLDNDCDNWGELLLIN